MKCFKVLNQARVRDSLMDKVGEVVCVAMLFRSGSVGVHPWEEKNRC